MVITVLRPIRNIIEGKKSELTKARLKDARL